MMKNILLACGSGICTSTAVNGKISKILDDNGYAGKYKITQCKVAEASPPFSGADWRYTPSTIVHETVAV